MDEDTSVAFWVVGNDTDSEGDVLTVSQVSQGANGTVQIYGDEFVVYTPTANWNGTDTFAYTVSDGYGGADTATVTVTVDAVNDEPVALDNTYTITVNTSLTVSLPGILDNDFDVDGDSLASQLVAEVSHGLLSLDPNGSLTYTPDEGWVGTDHFTYETADAESLSSAATVWINVITPGNTLPDAINDVVVSDEDVPVTLAVLPNDSDPNSDPLTILVADAGTFGSVVVNADNTLTYTPHPNFHGVDTFIYRISDGHGGSDQAAVTVTVNPSPDAPFAFDQARLTEQGVPITIGLDTFEPDGESLTYQVVSGPSNGTLTPWEESDYL